MDVEVLDLPGAANILYRTVAGDYTAFPPEEVAEAFGTFVATILSISPEEIAKLDGVPLPHFLSRYDFSQHIITPAALMCNIVFVTPYDLMDAAEFVKTIQEHFAKSTVVYLRAAMASCSTLVPKQCSVSAVMCCYAPGWRESLSSTARFAA
ncbi:MAG: hypothetical protein ACOC58_04500 [Chloroflexota bacterium]